MIDKVIALTIERSINRQWLFLGRMTGKGVPIEKIFFYLGADAKVFQNDYNKIADAAEADGFPFIRQFQGYTDKSVIQQVPAQMAQMWSYAQLLRYIRDSGQTCLVAWDDRMLTAPYGLLEILVDAYQNQPDFYAFQLRLRGLTWDIKLPEEDNQHEFLSRQRELFKTFIDPHHEPNLPYIFTRKGLYGYDESFVLSPEGAGWMLDKMFAMEDIDPDIKKFQLIDIAEEQRPIYFSRLNVDSWMRWEFVPFAETAVNAGKGIYCPRYPGYDFIEDPIPMGSLTEWASPERPDVSVCNAETALQYIGNAKNNIKISKYIDDQELKKSLGIF